ncbi:uncharacterized protein LOC141685123 [Apium graveolens]|uniref:uncharacterized protein LOC141685123 n=1 Tax=Apium graveolens TaxID=4045 RepID=UPI003D7988BD
MPIYGFAGFECPVKGITKSPLTMGQEPRQATQMLNFVVVKFESTYNAIMGRTCTHDFMEVPSSYHLVIKFPTRNGVGQERGDQKMARSYYIALLREDGAWDGKTEVEEFFPRKARCHKNEVEKLLEAGFIEEIQFSEWLATPVMVKKANRKWSMCVDFTDLNDACPKDIFSLPRIYTLIDATAGDEMLSFMDGFSG